MRTKVNMEFVLFYEATLVTRNETNDSDRAFLHICSFHQKKIPLMVSISKPRSPA